MSRKSYCCNGCKTAIPRNKPRIHCQICDEYNSCAECHVIESFYGLHSASHDYEIFLDGNRIMIKEGKTVKKLAVPYTLGQKPSESSLPRGFRSSTRSSNASTSHPGAVNTPEDYWGSVVREDKSLCPQFTRLVAAIFAHFDRTVYPLFTGWMEPCKFRAVWLSAGYATQDIPLLSYTVYPTPTPYNIHELDQTLALVYRTLSIEHRMVTREPLLSPLHERFGDAMAPVSVANSMPMLSLRGFAQYLLFQILVDPAETSTRLNHLLTSLPPLIDSETRMPFICRNIPRSCFPAMLDPAAEELRRYVEKQRRGVQAWKETREIENGWKPPIPGDDIYNNRMKSPDFLHMNGSSRWNGRFNNGF